MYIPTITARADNGRGASENNMDGQDAYLYNILLRRQQ